MLLAFDHFQNRVQNCVPNRVLNLVAKIYNAPSNKMSFMKIIDTEMKDVIVEQFLNTKQNVKRNHVRTYG